MGDAARTIRIHTGPNPPADLVALVECRHRRSWIAGTDFDSKVGLTLLQLLPQLAKTSTIPGTVITIYAG